MRRASSEAPSHDRGGRPLDPDRPNPESERPAAEPARASDGDRAGGDAAQAGAAPGSAGADTTGAGAAGQAGAKAPGLIGQLKATRDAVLRVVRAHIALAKAEAEAIKGEIAHAAAFAGIAVAMLLLLGIFLPIGAMLFLGEWLFGSIGWGLLLGAEMLVAGAVTAVVVGLRLDGPVRAAAIGAIAGIVAFIVFGASWFHRLWVWIGASTAVAVDGAYRPLVVAIVVVGIVLAVVGLVAGARVAGVRGGVGGLVGGFVAGALLGAFLADDFGWRVGAALGFATFYAGYVAALGVRIASGGIDTEKIKLRFWPQQTIDTTRETIEWAKARNPLGPKS
jgi:hypothetical protein